MAVALAVPLADDSQNRSALQSAQSAQTGLALSQSEATVEHRLPANAYRQGPVPDWVKPVPAFDSSVQVQGEASYGFRSRLHDFQFNGIEIGQSSYFNAIEYVLSNQYAVENYSNIEISFDPSYESLILHELSIKRGEQIINKLASTRFDLLRTEEDRASLIYDGAHTLAMVLDDVRSGDLIRYAYTVEGENPIYKGHREFRIHTELWNELDRQYSRILTATDKPLNRRVRGADVPMVISEQDGVQEIVIDQRGVSEFTLEDDVPSWHYNRGTLVFSDMTDWRSVAEWVRPMYQLPEQSEPEIATIASVIKTAHEDINAQVGAALRWVQEEVRYFGVELGTNSHWPSRPAETFARRFGDCKDKALLLMAILQELGVPSHAALVNTERGLESENYPYRMHAFDHVIVHIMLDGESHFVDPTRRNQAGVLGEMHEPDYGRALVLSEDTLGLTEMGSSRSRTLIATSKSITLESASGDLPTGKIHAVSEEPVQLQVKTVKHGYTAERLRGRLETVGIKQMSRNYEDYYSDFFNGISATKHPEVKEEPGNSLLVNESYQLPEFWQADENVQRYRWLFADEVIAYLDKPEDTYNRQLPYELIHPILIEETWNVRMPAGLRLDDLDAVYKNEWMAFSKKSTLSDDGTMLSVSFRYRTLANEVAAEDLKAYADSVDKIVDLASFYIEDEPSLGAAIKVASDKVSSELTQGGSVSGLFMLLVSVAGFLRFYIVRKRPRIVPV